MFSVIDMRYRKSKKRINFWKNFIRDKLNPKTNDYLFENVKIRKKR